MGNYVVLQCENEEAILYIVHMQQGSIPVNECDVVQVGEEIGKVGNSGNTTEPDLHIHVEKDGVGVPIYFDGKFLVRNSIVKSTLK